MTIIGKSELLQQVLASLKVARSADDRAGFVAPRTGSEGRTNPTSPGAPREALAETMRRRLGRIDPDDPHRAKRALRALIEAALQSRWGMALANDPAFHALVDEVQRQIDSEPELRPLVDAALGQFLSSDDSGSLPP